MKQLLQPLALKLLTRSNIFPTPITDRSSLISLMQGLYPRATESELIRLGPSSDGGYLVPDDLENIAACFSPGVSDIAGFERDCARLGMQAFLADASVENPPGENDNFSFQKNFIGATNAGNFITLDKWIGDSLPDSQGDLMLQMDIEGFEYEALLAVSNDLIRRFRIMVVEFHNLHQLWSNPFYKLASRVFDKILNTHSCVHIHPNNIRPVQTVKGLAIPPIAEFTFLRNDRGLGSGYASEFPHPLDADNTPKASTRLPECWHG